MQPKPLWSTNSYVLRQLAYEHFDEQLMLHFRWLENGTNTVYHGSYDDL